MIVTIDGPAGSGKSTTARAVARELGFRHLDSGAFYRALTRAALHANIDPKHWDDLGPDDLAALDVHARPAEEGYRLFAGEVDLTGQLRSGEVNEHVSRMARIPAVRSWLLDRLRAAAHDNDLVADGRDMGTVVFPDAQLKVFLTAGLPTRAKRRLLQQGVANPGEDQIAREAERIAQRDRLDSERLAAPLRRPDDAVDIDTTALSFDQQVERIVAHARERQHPRAN